MPPTPNTDARTFRQSVADVPPVVKAASGAALFLVLVLGGLWLVFGRRVEAAAGAVVGRVFCTPRGVKTLPAASPEGRPARPAAVVDADANPGTGVDADKQRPGTWTAPVLDADAKPPRAGVTD